ncbi:metalloprotease [Actinospongicola halichondriae]|uniref:metalloprotease n=1 Tax=Actinospongicola halichondriae TaxID=3236844 RepID=UPI003D3A351A
MSAKAHFRIAGIPVRIEPVFWIATVFLAFNLQDARLIIIWVAVVLVSILVHELGHAFALKVYGQKSSIVLHGFGGVTLSQRQLTKVQSIIVSLAGPITALVVLGIPALLIRDSDYGLGLWDAYRGGFGLWPVVVFAVYVNIWWSIANLLPIRPLDGGNVMTELIGIQRARILSIVVGGGAAIWAYLHADEGFRYAALFAAFLAFINFSEYRRATQGAGGPSAFDVESPDPGTGRPGRGSGIQRGATPRHGGRPTGPPSRGSGQTVSPMIGGVDPSSAESFAWNLLRRGDAAGARRVLQRSTGAVGPFVGPTVELANGAGVEALAGAYLANPTGPSNLVPATVAADSGHAVTLARLLAGQGSNGLEAAASLQTHLHYAERFDHAAAVGEVVFSVSGTNAQVAFDTACSWARAGDADRSLEWIRRAVAAGFAAPKLLDGEPDLESTRRHPGWRSVRGDG